MFKKPTKGAAVLKMVVGILLIAFLIYRNTPHILDGQIFFWDIATIIVLFSIYTYLIYSGWMSLAKLNREEN